MRMRSKKTKRKPKTQMSANHPRRNFELLELLQHHSSDIIGPGLGYNNVINHEISELPSTA